MSEYRQTGRLRYIFLVVLGVAAVLSRGMLSDAPGEEGVPPTLSGSDEVVRLFEARRSGVMVAVGGTVDRLLPDDEVGSRHQRFIVRLEGGHTLLVAHNIDLADRVPLRVGDRVDLYGEYEWNEQGGVLHWTHHDPQGQRGGGWIEWQGERYR